MTLVEMKTETGDFSQFKENAYNEALAHIANGSINVIREKKK
jgi:hypothetical protein